MKVWTAVQDLVLSRNPLVSWVVMFLVIGLLVSVFRGFFRARKIQPNGFRWRTFRNEMFFAVISLTVSATVIGYLMHLVTSKGWAVFNHAPASGWVVGLEYALYFLGFDTYFYWFHRLMHKEPIYSWVHKLHHYSVSPNVLTTLSVNPLESLINGGFVPLFITLFTVHQSTMALITPTNIIMGLYVHCGYEFFPRWWHKSWATKWFITATFHDQHHRYFNFNYGGYTTIWDFICGTVRPKFLADFEQLKARARRPLTPTAPLPQPE